jgi:hypothetical protein
VGFSREVKEEALVKSGRRCCVCREFKGIGIEIHHIDPEAQGGADTLENAIALCFDCHCAAGHYNADHPRGSKYSPRELKRHRDRHWKDVEEGRISTAPEQLTTGLHVRHVICLSETEAKQVLSGTFRNDHLRMDRVLQSPISAFMEKVLEDEAPHAQASLARLGLATPGSVSIDDYWTDRAMLSEAYPEFSAASAREIEDRDILGGPIASRLLEACVRQGFPASELGSLHVHHNMCGEEGWYLEYRVRRPLLAGEAQGQGAITPRPLKEASSSTDRLATPPVILHSGEGLTIPTGILLSPADEDDFSFEWVANEPYRHDWLDFTACTDATARRGDDSYLMVGPSFSIASVDVMAGEHFGTVGIRPFDIRRVYLLGHGFLCGSCPHALAELENGEVEYLGEILTDARGVPRSATLVMPEGSVRLHICELEFETTVINSICVDDIPVTLPKSRLSNGDLISVDARGGTIVVVSGSYDSVIGEPRSAAELRFKRSLVQGGLRVLGQHVRREREPASGQRAAPIA